MNEKEEKEKAEELEREVQAVDSEKADPKENQENRSELSDDDLEQIAGGLGNQFWNEDLLKKISQFKKNIFNLDLGHV